MASIERIQFKRMRYLEFAFWKICWVINTYVSKRAVYAYWKLSTVSQNFKLYKLSGKSGKVIAVQVEKCKYSHNKLQWRKPCFE